MTWEHLVSGAKEYEPKNSIAPDRCQIKSK